MKKSLVAIAALAATGAFAQSSVTLYGRLDLGMQSNKVESTSAAGVGTSVKTTELAGAQNLWTGSRIGIRGSEDLGGGLKANFVYEFRLNQDGTAAADADTANFGRVRTSLVQLQGDFGSVAVGTYLNPFDDIRLSAGNYGLAGGWSLDKINGGVGFDARSINSVGYRSPAFGGGFFATFGTSNQTVSYQTGVTPGLSSGSNSSKGVIGSLGYSNGPISALVAVGQGKARAAGATSAAAAVGGTPFVAPVSAVTASAPAVGAEVKINDFGLRASYNVGFAVPYLSFENAKRTTTGIDAANASFGLGSNTSRGFEVGSSFPMGAFSPYVTFAVNKQTAVNGAGVTTIVKKTNALQVGTKYDLSKRTFAYTGFGSSKDTTENAATVRKESGFALGLVHNF